MLSRRTLLKLWILFVVASLFAAAYLFHRGWSLQTNLESLLPATEADAGFNKAINEYRSRLGRKILFVLRGTEWSAVKESADQFISQVKNYEDVIRFQTLQDSSRFEELFRVYGEHKSFLLTPNQMQKIEGDQADGLEKEVLIKLYSPMSGGISLTQDPLGLFPDFFSRLGNQSKLMPREGYLVQEVDGQFSLLLPGEMTESWKNSPRQNQVLGDLESSAQKWKRNSKVEILYTGLPFYTNVAVNQSLNEISTFGTLSIVGIILLFVLFFNTLRPLLWSLSVIFLSTFVAAVWAEFLLGTIHVFTLVIGSSVIGLIIDYLLHFYFQSFVPDVVTGEDAIRKISSPLFWCWSSTALGFAVLSFANFPALRQLSVFSTIGITFAYWTVTAVLPFLRVKKYLPKPFWKSCTALPFGWLRLSLTHKMILNFVLVAVAVLIFFISHINDDISILQERPRHLAEYESEIRKVTGVTTDLSFAVLRADSIETLLKGEEKLLSSSLNEIDDNENSKKAMGISQWFPSLEQQRKSDQAYVKLKSSVSEVLSQVGIASQKREGILKDLFEKRNPDPIHMIEKLSLLQGLPIFDQWLGADNGKFYSVVLLGDAFLKSKSGILDGGAEFYISQTAKDISRIFGAARIEMTWLVSAIVLMTFLILIFMRSLPRAICIVFPAALGSVLGLSLSGLFIGHLNLFNWLGAALVFFVGIDYPFFYDELDEVHSAPTFMAMLLSWATTILSFGILGLSQTQAVASFGVTLFLGIVISFVLAPMAARRMA